MRPAASGFLVGCVFLGFSFGTVFAARRPSDPPHPYSDWGACPFECCTYQGWVATRLTAVHAEPLLSSAIRFRLAPGDSVVADTGVVVTNRIGLAVASAEGTIGGAEVAMSRGDTIAVLHDLGEGFWAVWLDDHVDSTEILDGSIIGEPGFLLHMVRSPDVVWWARIRDMSGHVGWVRDPHDFRHIDACE